MKITRRQLARIINEQIDDATRDLKDLDQVIGWELREFWLTMHSHIKGGRWEQAADMADQVGRFIRRNSDRPEALASEFEYIFNKRWQE